MGLFVASFGKKRSLLEYLSITSEPVFQSHYVGKLKLIGGEDGGKMQTPRINFQNQTRQMKPASLNAEEKECLHVGGL